jgi:hypothetical protein
MAYADSNTRCLPNSHAERDGGGVADEHPNPLNYR